MANMGAARPNCQAMLGVVFGANGELLSCARCSALADQSKKAARKADRKEKFDRRMSLGNLTTGVVTAAAAVGTYLKESKPKERPFDPAKDPFPLTPADVVMLKKIELETKKAQEVIGQAMERLRKDGKFSEHGNSISDPKR